MRERRCMAVLALALALALALLNGSNTYPMRTGV
jgi:hypothetical protein